MHSKQNRLDAIAACGALVLALSAGASAQWKNLNGQKVPAVAAQKWLNTKGESPTSESLRGKVWLIEFFATW